MKGEPVTNCCIADNCETPFVVPEEIPDSEYLKPFWYLYCEKHRYKTTPVVRVINQPVEEEK